MPQSFAKNTQHLVFSTKDRVPFLEENSRPRMHAYLASTLRELGCPTITVGGVADHVHILFDLSRTLSLSEAVSKVKSHSSKWFKDECRRFSWQAGYGSFSVGFEQIPVVIKYIQGQDGHHRTRTFQDEFRAILTEHNMGWDERYIWD